MSSILISLGNWFFAVLLSKAIRDMNNVMVASKMCKCSHCMRITINMHNNGIKSYFGYSLKLIDDSIIAIVV